MALMIDESIDIDITSDKNDPVVNTRLRFSFSENSYSLLDEDLNEIQLQNMVNKFVLMI